MARYTGPAYKKSRRLEFSTLENGKILQEDLTLQDNMEMIEKEN